ncbi:MAG TPA: ATP-binding cassette domain-containing protein [Thermoanaerobaculia bacterium]|nr:ATP-binding cassette domain-containing protein [Thermoanaerobaculia bacterium]
MTASAKRIAPIRDVSFSVKPGSAYALVGREGSGKTAIVRCTLGELRPESGRVAVLGLDPRRERRALRRRVRFDESQGEIRLDTEPATTLLVTNDPRQAREADQVGFLKAGRLVLDDANPVLLARFRRIRYVNEITESRTEYGNELDLFDAVRVKVRGWGVDAVVSNFDESVFERFRAMEGVEDVRAEPMTLEEIFAAVTGEAAAI